MGKFLGKTIKLKGSYRYDAEGPTGLDVERTYASVDDFLRKRGQPIVPVEVQPLPYLDEGFITSSKAFSCYILNNCLVANGFYPYFSGVCHVIKAVVSSLKNEPEIDKTFNLLKGVAGWEWTRYWKDEERRVIDVPEQFENANLQKLLATGTPNQLENANKMTSHLQRLLTE